MQVDQSDSEFKYKQIDRGAFYLLESVKMHHWIPERAQYSQCVRRQERAAAREKN